MKTLAIISQKGGSGKTTIAVHMAVCAIRQGYHTAIIDIDPQGSAFDWYQSREVQNELNAVQAQAGQHEPLRMTRPMPDNRMPRRRVARLARGSRAFASGFRLPKDHRTSLRGRGHPANLSA